MKTLKKALSVVLALAMVLGMTVVASAAKFTDAADITDKEAIDVMNAVGVFVGSNGKINAQSNLTRAQAAKLIAYLDLGEKAAEALPALAVFSDVPATHWAAKYVAYCYDAGYVAGVGAGKFSPDGNVTGYQFAKMLLCVVGYDAQIEALLGTNWQIATAKLMQKTGIGSKSNYKGTAALTREEAARFCLEALQATMVEYASKGTSIKINGAEITTGASKAELVTSGKDYATAIDDDVAVGASAANLWYLELGEKLYEGDLVYTPSQADSFGRPSHDWDWKEDEIGTYADKAKFVFTKELDGDDAEKALKGYTFATATDIANFDAFAAMTGNGAVVEVYANSDKVVTDVVAIYPIYAKVTGVTKKSETKTRGAYTDYTLTYDGGTFTGRVFSSVVDEDEDKDTLVLNGTFEKNDYATFYTNDEGYYANASGRKGYLDPVTSVSGVFSKYTSKEVLTIDGKEYEAFWDVDESTLSISTKSQDFYLDKYGYVICAYSDVETEFAYVQGVSQKFTQNEDTTFDEYWYATIVLTDGTVKTVCTDDDDYTAKVGSIIEYTVDDDDMYTFDDVDPLDATVAEIAAIDDTTKVIDTLYANASTKYFVLNYKEVKDEQKFQKAVTAYTGYKNVPSYASDTNIVFAIDNSSTLDGIADVVFIDTYTDALETGKYIYACDSWTVTKNGQVKVDTIVAGEASTVALTVDEYDDYYESGKLYANAANLKAGTELTTTYTKIKNNGGVVVANGVVLTKANVGGTGTNAVVFADNAPVYKIDTYDDTVEVLAADDITSDVEGDVYLEVSADFAKVNAVYVLWDSEN